MPPELAADNAPVIQESAEFELRSAVNWAARLLGDDLVRQIVEDELQKLAREFIESQFQPVGVEVPF